LSSTPADIAVTLNGLSHIVTADLGRDLSHDLIALLNHSRPNIRKRAVLALYNVITKYPDALQLGIVRIREKLEDPDPCRALSGP
jgi:AP-3 complex subunit delta